jgi:bis(5'-nucleosyl)-tetraphosphatase (symmetrical)
MADYVVGDLQGCLDELERLLDRIRFRPGRDRLWLVGDLVNRGPRSLDSLRFVRDLGESALAVLGNHDLHLLAASEGVRAPRSRDTLQEILDAPDREPLLEWLRRLPLVHRDRGVCMVHAGLPPQWDVAEAAERASELEAVLSGPDWRPFMHQMYGDEPARWREDLEGPDRLRYLVNAFTRMRYLDARGGLDLQEGRPPGQQAPGLVPWFAFPGRRSRGQPIVFGHWATLRFGGAPDPEERVHHLDTGCVWGGSLSALRLDDLREFRVPGRPAAVGA